MDPGINGMDCILTTYKDKVPVFSDRDYYDTIGDKKLENSFIVQIPRHFKSFIEIEVYRPVKIYRILSKENENQFGFPFPWGNDIFHDWKKTNIEVSVTGISSNHTMVVSKIFESGRIKLDSGGPESTSPILIQDLSRNSINCPIKLIQ